MIRKYHHYELWEDYMNGMYKQIYGKERRIMLNKAISFTGDANLYGKWMLKVVELWPICCEQNLTDIHINQKAWIGHAAVCLALGCPEDITRLAWGCLSKKQQDEANNQADISLRAWNEKQGHAIHSKVGKARLQAGNTRRSTTEAGITMQSTFLPNDM